jgi:hypothetical protein
MVFAIAFVLVLVRTGGYEQRQNQIDVGALVARCARSFLDRRLVDLAQRFRGYKGMRVTGSINDLFAEIPPKPRFLSAVFVAFRART